MNELNKKRVWKKIQLTGEKLQPLLKPSYNHPDGRNAYAHVAICIKNKFSASYKDIPDEKYNEVINYINFIKNNPN